MNETINNILDKLRQGDMSIVYECGPILNEFISSVLNKDCDDNEIITMDKVLRICNILYNRTDLELLPVEDGVYDLLLEKYKTYNPNFQVGSETVDFNIIENNTEKEHVEALVFHTDKEMEKIKDGFFYNQLYLEPKMNIKDLNQAPFYFTENISRRTHNTQHEHPELVGTLDKCKFVLMEEAINKGVANDNNVKVLERDFFADHISKGILDPNREISMVLELKYDGVSVEADCCNTVLSARTRGDTSIGVASDITPLLEGYPFHHAGKMIGNKPIGIKFEAIMTHNDLYNFNIAKNYSYKNCRTAIVGLMGSSDASIYRDYITLVPLAIDREDVPNIEWDRQLEIEFLNKYYVSKGQPLRYSVIKGTYKDCLFLIQKFLEEAEVARNFLDFMYDGIVVSYLDEDLREALGRKNYINKYSMAVKFNPLKKQTIFRGYKYTIGQDGLITPMIYYDQVEFYGTIHHKSTGSSLQRFNELGLRIGDIVNVEYTNDVMPYVTKPECSHNDNNTNPLCEFPTVCPDCGTKLELSKTGKSAICPNLYCESRVIARMSNMLAKLNLKDFGRQRIIALGKCHLHEIIDLTRDDVYDILGEAMSDKFVDTMNELKTKPILDYEIVGALGFSNIATKKWKLIFQHMTLNQLYDLILEGNLRVKLSMIKGIGPMIIDTIEEEFQFFKEDIEYILFKMTNICPSIDMVQGKSIRCSGFRNKELMEQLRSQGYDADDNGSVTKSTDILLVPYEDYSSGKTRKAGPNTIIVPVQEFVENMDKYLK